MHFCQSIPGSNKLALGTAGFGSFVSRDEAFAILDGYAEAGGNFLDTANVYAEWLPEGRGRSETTVGAWLKDRGMRSRMVVGTKGGHPDLATGRKRMSPEELEHDLQESLERLGLDRVDVYWFHRDDPAKPIAEILGWAARQIAGGRIGEIGCSNWTLPRLQQANATGSPAPFCANQIGWSLADRNTPPAELPDMVFMNGELYAYHVATRLPVAAYAAQGGGFFARHKRGDPSLSGAYANPRNERRRILADALADRHGATPNQIALAWLWHHPFPVLPIVGPRTLGQLQDSLGAAALRLSSAEVSSLSAAEANVTP